MSRAVQIISDIDGFSLFGTTAVITGVVSEGVTVEFSLSEPVDADETVAISMTNGMVDDYGQTVEGFTGEVANNSENTPITVHSASIPADDPKKLYVVMEGAVMMESAEGFSLTDKEITGYTISDGTIIFTLSSSVLLGENLTVSYDGNGTLRAMNNDKIKVFSKAVVNNSTDEGSPPLLSYLTFSSPNTFSIETFNKRKNWDGKLEYSTDGVSWSEWDGTTAINAALSDGKYKLFIGGTNNTKITGSDANYRWVLTGSNISCTGNIESLLDHAKVAEGQHPVMAQYCYYSMFQSCTGLTTAPALPATTLADSCYYQMFSNCKFKVTINTWGVFTKTWRIPKSGTITSTPNNWNTSMLFGVAYDFNEAVSINTTYYVENDPK
jgi:hypothetical protein